jgi:hypothetical protein
MRATLAISDGALADGMSSTAGPWVDATVNPSATNTMPMPDVSLAPDEGDREIPPS